MYLLSLSSAHVIQNVSNETILADFQIINCEFYRTHMVDILRHKLLPNTPLSINPINESFLI